MNDSVSQLEAFLADFTERHNYIMQDQETASVKKYIEAISYLKTKEALEKAINNSTKAITLPCKPGDTIYRVVRWGKRNVDIRERIVSAVEYNAAGEWVIHSTGEDVLGKKCFLTKEAAEKALLTIK